MVVSSVLLLAPPALHPVAGRDHAAADASGDREATRANEQVELGALHPGFETFHLGLRFAH